ncbi:MAG: HNH endonuclease [Ornithinimicrobium sp.]|uniref:HNH endonuclease n=1 Tax=Ornithinimicrobium sp. TaxID=1977084 RepID=UPI003D9B9E04
MADRDTHRRRFDPAVRELLFARDQHCATPWCDAPSRHADHIVAHTDGGPTTPDNGQGLCERCNYDKDTPGFSAAPGREPDGRRVTRLTTPTGHTYEHHPPPSPGRRPRPAPPRHPSPHRHHQPHRRQHHQPHQPRPPRTSPRTRHRLTKTVRGSPHPSST